MPASLRRRTRAFIVIVSVVLVAASCSSDGSPTDYADQVDPTTGVSNVEQNFIEGCEVSRGLVQGENAEAVCACTYKRIVAEIDFIDFVAANERLAETPSLLADPPAGSTEKAIQDFVKDCITRV